MQDFSRNLKVSYFLSLGILRNLIKYVYFLTLGFLIFSGFAISLVYGINYPTQLFAFGYFYQEVGQPYSFVIFGTLGILLYFRFKLQAILMLLFAYSAWEITPQLLIAFQRPFFAGGGIFSMLIWLSACSICFYLLKPRVNLTNWGLVAVFIFYANREFLSLLSWETEIFSELIWCIFILMSFYPRVDARTLRTTT